MRTTKAWTVAASRDNPRGASSARAGRSVAAAGLIVAALGACTTTEGTNAFTDFGTFEREVMTSTAQGVGLVPQDEKPELDGPRAPLVLPADSDRLPQPRQSRVSELPEDSDTVQIDASGLSEEDINRLRNARVIDPRTMAGRPLTESETRQLTAQMQQAGRTVTRSGDRPLYLPPDEYFTTVNNQDLVCLAPNGDLVPLDDPSCPPEIRAALQSS